MILSLSRERIYLIIFALEIDLTSPIFKQQCLGFPKPPDNITPLQLWEKVTSKVQEVTTKAPSSLLGSPLLSKKVLTGDQWKLIDQIAEVDLNWLTNLLPDPESRIVL